MSAYRVLVKLGRRLLADVRGATAVEYGLIVALIVIAMVAALLSVADASTGLWTNVSDEVSRAN